MIRNPTHSTFKVILGVWELMVISRKQEHLHSYNSQKCINDHQQRKYLGEGKEKKANTILFCMKLYFLWASSCLKCQPTAKREERIKLKLGKKIQVILFVLQSPLCASWWEGQGLSTQQSSPTPLFPGFQCLGKSSHFMSTVLQNRNSNKFQHEYSRKHKIFQRLWDWMISQGRCFCLSIIWHLLS